MSAITLNAPALFDLSGRTALVTGAGSGIGQGIALGLAQCGADVACLDRRTDGGLADTASMIEAAGRRAIVVTADVTDRGAVAAAVAETEAKLGALGIAVNAAGIANANPAEEMEEEQYQTLMDINMKGVFLSC
jgi:NAD(P)-dependent dehydrogenase (short-subunit alcohol dehydrogenase family)